MPRAGVVMAGINAAGAVREYVAPAVVIVFVVRPANVCHNQQHLLGDSEIPEALLSSPKKFG